MNIFAEWIDTFPDTNSCRSVSELYLMIQPDTDTHKKSHRVKCPGDTGTDKMRPIDLRKSNYHQIEKGFLSRFNIEKEVNRFHGNSS